MLKDLVSVANKLDGLGLTKDADFLDNLILKIAAPPMIDVFPLDKNEPTAIYEQDEDGNFIEDEDGNFIVSKNIPRVKRNKRILRDERSREALELQMMRSRLPREELESAELEEWYKSISALGDNVILIPFDKSEIDKNYEVLNGIASIFNIRDEPRNYKELFNKINILSYTRYTQGDLDKLKEIFPSLWADISETLRNKKLEEEDVVYVLYNQETSPIRPGFTKDPEYNAHDYGHAVFDSEDGDPEFKYKVALLMRNISELYTYNKSEEEGEEGDQTLSETFNSEDEDEVQLLAMEFFSNNGNSQDIFADIFGQFVSGRLSLEQIYIPEEIIMYGKSYFISDDKIDLAKSIFQKFIADIKKYINPNVEYGTFASGPLSHLAGSVILQDV